MIPKAYIAQWRDHAPWLQSEQVEQDLILSRILIELFSDPYLRQNLAFRGGTALHKLHLLPAPRYSEDIDLVQIVPGPIKPILEKIQEVVQFFDEPRQTKVSGHGAKALYRFTSEDEQIRMRVKVEINCQEHFHVLPWSEIPFSIQNPWYAGSTSIRSYDFNELLGTKFRALYQRKKGRDLFDLDYARRESRMDLGLVVDCFQHYTKAATGSIPTRKLVEQNLLTKRYEREFLGDIYAILRPGVDYNQDAAFEWILDELVPLLE
jgi:predicted nucleotidyltransferase component of viral defense system